MTVGDATAIVNKVVGDCAAQGYTPVEVSGDGTVAISWLTIPAMQGNVDVQPNLPFFVHNAATKPMYDALAKYAPTVTTSSNFGEIVLENWSRSRRPARPPTSGRSRRRRRWRPGSMPCRRGPRSVACRRLSPSKRACRTATRASS